MRYMNGVKTPKKLFFINPFTEVNGNFVLRLDYLGGFLPSALADGKNIF
jgi:hypothetical protein